MSMSGKPRPEITIEGEHCPGAVVEWYQCSAYDFDLSLKAKKHLVWLGWIFSYCDKKTRWELRYKSPFGKTYISLRTACKACIQENNLLHLLHQSSLQESQQSQSQEPTNSKVTGGRPRRRKKPSEDSAGGGGGGGGRRRRHDSGEKNNPHHENDSICEICLIGGLILLCDGCPASFHAECIGLDHVPEGDWFCPSCSCRICNSSAEETQLANNFLACDQCQRRFHIGCLASRGFNFLKLETDSNELWFCNEACEEIFFTLHNMLGKPVLVGDDGNLTWTLLTSIKNGNISEMESKLNVALGVIHECFEPIMDPVLGRDIAADIMFSRYSCLPRLNFRGFYTVILERNDEVISVASTRIYGQKVAEVPLVATRDRYRNRGMCRILMGQLEKMLVKLGVERLVLPAAAYLIETWTNSFGFAKMTHSDQYDYIGYPLANFPDTTLCHKSLKDPLMLYEA